MHLATRPAKEVHITRQSWSVLIVSTLAFTVCFMVWMMFGVIGIPIKKALDLNSTEFGLLTAMPVLAGSLIRVPLGIWTDRFGGQPPTPWLDDPIHPGGRGQWEMARLTLQRLSLDDAGSELARLAL